MSEWISVKDRLPEPAGRYFDCLVSVFSIMEGGWHEDWKTFQCVEKAKYDSVQKLWVFGIDGCSIEYPPINALVPESDFMDGEELLQVSDFVTHWMPLPEPPKRE